MANFQEIPSMVPLHKVVSRFILDPSLFSISVSNIVESTVVGYRPDRPISPHPEFQQPSKTKLTQPHLLFEPSIRNSATSPLGR
jgi:hypothetical protein